MRADGGRVAAGHGADYDEGEAPGVGGIAGGDYGCKGFEDGLLGFERGVLAAV